MRRRVIIVVIIVVAVVIVGVVAWFLLRNTGANEDAVYVMTVEALTGDASGVNNRYAGVVEPQSSETITADSGRKIASVEVAVGDEVKEGDLLYTYDAGDTQDKLAEAQLDLERYQSEAASLQEEIATLNQQIAEAPEDEQLSYTIEIQTAEMDLKKNEYDQESKQQEIDKLQASSENLEVTSTASGVVRSINDSMVENSVSDYDSDSDSDYSSSSGSGSGSEKGFITIVQTDTYRVKGVINETNLSSIAEGDPIIIRSRVDEEETWEGSVDEINTDETEKRNDDVYSSSGSDEQTTSSNYAFYVILDDSKGLILGQHVYIELDNGQLEDKSGIWLDEFYVVDADEDPYVWVSNGNNRLEKRSVTLGEYDEDLGKYEITDGLSETDCIAFPEDDFREGLPTTINDNLQSTSEGDSDFEWESDSDSGWYSDSDSDWYSDSDSDWYSDSDSDWYSDSDSDWYSSSARDAIPDGRVQGRRLNHGEVST